MWKPLPPHLGSSILLWPTSPLRCPLYSNRPRQLPSYTILFFTQVSSNTLHGLLPFIIILIACPRFLNSVPALYSQANLGHFSHPTQYLTALSRQLAYVNVISWNTGSNTAHWAASCVEAWHTPLVLWIPMLSCPPHLPWKHFPQPAWTLIPRSGLLLSPHILMP